MPCRASAADKPQIAWMLKASSGLVTNIVSTANIQLDPSGDLTYASVKSDNRGKHICEACNTAGCKSVDAFLNVLCKQLGSLWKKCLLLFWYLCLLLLFICLKRQLKTIYLECTNWQQSSAIEQHFFLPLNLPLLFDFYSM